MTSILTKIVSILLLFVLAAGVWLVWVVTHPATTPADTNNPPVEQDPTTTIPDPQAKDTVLKDIVSAYNSLFISLKATPVAFTSVSSADGVAGSLYSFYGKDISDYKIASKAASAPLKIALVDLNSDTVLDGVVYEELPGFCGSAGCPIDVYLKEGNNWKQVLRGIGAQTIGISFTKVEGHPDLYVTVSGETTYESQVVRFSWNPKTKYYEQHEAVATWDGVAFTLIR